MAERGQIVLALLFLLLLSVSGLALLTHTGLHLRIVAARKDRRLAAAALERTLVLNLHRYREKLGAADMNAFPEPESGFFNRGTFPDLLEDGFASRHQFSSIPLSAGDGFRVLRVLDLVQVSRDGGRLGFSGRAGVDLFQGSFSASEPGLLIARRGAEDSRRFPLRPRRGNRRFHGAAGRGLQRRPPDRALARRGPGVAGAGPGLAAHQGKIRPGAWGRPDPARGVPGAGRGRGGGGFRAGRPAKAGVRRRRRASVHRFLPGRPPLRTQLPRPAWAR